MGRGGWAVLRTDDGQTLLLTSTRSSNISREQMYTVGLRPETFDIVVAMYHDQGHIPMKLLAFDSGVNVSIGLPIIRTSVDHGTAFDIAGTGEAGEESMRVAIEVALKMVAARRAGMG